MNSRICLIIFSFMILQVFSATAYAVSVKGYFVATVQCEAYQSKKNKNQSRECYHE